jgi:hypothetical protein
LLDANFPNRFNELVRPRAWIEVQRAGSEAPFDGRFCDASR